VYSFLVFSRIDIFTPSPSSATLYARRGSAARRAASGLIGSLPNRAWLVPVNQATVGQAQRVQDEYVWLTGRSS